MHVGVALRRGEVVLVGLLIALSGWALSAPFEPAGAAGTKYTVGSNSDSVAVATLAQCQSGTNTVCALRDALGYATSGQDTIVFNSAGRGTITLRSTPTLATSVTIAGPTSGAGVTVSGGGTVGGFVVSSQATADGKVGGSGGGIANNGTLTLTNSTLTGNTASTLGGGIDNEGTLTVTNSTFSSNSTSGTGGGIYNGATTHLSNSIISGNTGGDLSFNSPPGTSHNLIGGTALLGPLGNHLHAGGARGGSGECGDDRQQPDGHLSERLYIRRRECAAVRAADRWGGRPDESLTAIAHSGYDRRARTEPVADPRP